MTTDTPSLSKEERIANLLSDDDFWVPYPEATEALSHIQKLLQSPRERRPGCLAVLGESSSGKSQLLARIVKKFSVPYDPNVETPQISIVGIEMPAAPEPAAMVRELLRGIGARYSTREPIDELQNRLQVVSTALSVKAFAIDEYHNGDQGTIRQQRIMLNLTRSISSRTQANLVIAGLDAAGNFLKNDDQLDKRFKRIQLPLWRADERTRSFLKTFEKKLELRQLSGLADVEMTDVILQVAGNRLGNISRLLRRAAVEAIETGEERITEKHLKNAAEFLPGIKCR